MNDSIRRQWANALTSGQYQQGRCYLRSHNDLFSVLGVLADIAVKKNVGIWRKEEFLQTFNTGTVVHPYRFVLPDDQMTDRDYGHAVFFLPNKVLVSCGLSFGQALYMMQRNDDGDSFADLAKEIENDFPFEHSVQLKQPAALAVC